MNVEVSSIKARVFKPVSQKVSGEPDLVKINQVIIDTKKNRELAVNSGAITIMGRNNSFSGMDQALIVVDGQLTTSNDWIQPCKVRSVHVLKDSDAAIYGTRGGNGVNIITLIN